MGADVHDPDLSGLHRATRDRLTALLSEQDGAALGMPVPACPGWAAGDVLAHVVAVRQDAMSGRLAGPASGILE